MEPPQLVCHLCKSLFVPKIRVYTINANRQVGLYLAAAVLKVNGRTRFSVSGFSFRLPVSRRRSLHVFKTKGRQTNPLALQSFIFSPARIRFVLFNRASVLQVQGGLLLLGPKMILWTPHPTIVSQISQRWTAHWFLAIIRTLICTSDSLKVGLVLEAYHKSRRCSRDTYPASYITKRTNMRR